MARLMSSRSMRLPLAGALALLASSASPILAAELSAEEIVRRATDRNALGFESGTAQVRMLLQSKRGEKRERRILSKSRKSKSRKSKSRKSKSRKSKSLSRSLIRFLSPADVQGTAFLLIERGGGQSDDMYLYLPALKRTRRIAGSQKNGAFMGSDFRYADMESRDIKNSTYVMQADEAKGGVDCYHIVATPKPGDEGAYGKLDLWIRKDNFLPQQIKFYDKKGAFMKVFTLHEARQIDGHWVATKSQMWTQRSGHSTFIFVESIDTKTEISPAELTPENLSKD